MRVTIHVGVVFPQNSTPSTGARHRVVLGYQGPAQTFPGRGSSDFLVSRYPLQEEEYTFSKRRGLKGDDGADGDGTGRKLSLRQEEYPLKKILRLRYYTTVQGGPFGHTSRHLSDGVSRSRPGASEGCGLFHFRSLFVYVGAHVEKGKGDLNIIQNCSFQHSSKFPIDGIMEIVHRLSTAH